ncbi:MAG: hypothetical protein PSN36_07435, partial [Gammaproteobacteria bacterium]|nr:hypothetical protein [Gammaproteobacteria bacterium]
LMNILNYKLNSTNELLSARTGLLAPMHLMQSLELTKAIDQYFPALNSNSALKAMPLVVNKEKPLSNML